MTDLIVRISVIRCEQERFDRIRALMVEVERALRPGIEAMPGLLGFYAGADEAAHSLNNTSIWDSLEHAQQLDHFQPMLDAGKQFVAEGARFERPIMNYLDLWKFGPLFS